MKNWFIIKEDNELYFKELELHQYNKFIQYIDPSLSITKEEFEQRNILRSMFKSSKNNAVLCMEIDTNAYNDLEPRFSINFIETAKRELDEMKIINDIDMNKCVIRTQLYLLHVIFGYKECKGCF